MKEENTSQIMEIKYKEKIIIKKFPSCNKKVS